MNAQLQTQTKVVPQSSFTLAQAGVLQRQCACGQHTVAGGECEACRQRREGLTQQAYAVPPIVHTVLSSPGQSLDTNTRAFMEPRFGHDFSQVRVHTDARAAESAWAVNALAYTAGQSLVFGKDQYAPGTTEGKKLIAHELTHVVQQSGTIGPSLARSTRVADSSNAAEREAETVATQVLNSDIISSIHTTSSAIQRAEAPYINKVTVDLSAQSVSLTWKGQPPAKPGSDSFTCSTGKGYSNPGDDPGTCTRDCCSGADVQCAPPFDKPGAVGSCCTPIGSSFWTGRPRSVHNGWNYWTPVEPLHTAMNRGIALHQHNEVAGKAIGHGCIRMEESNAERIFRYSRGRATNVTISGKATVECPDDRQCAATTQPTPGKKAELQITNPDAENPGSGGGGDAVVSLPVAGQEEELV